MAIFVRTLYEQPAVWVPSDDTPPPEWIEWVRRRDEEEEAEEPDERVVILDM